jgi:hypothetical protein
VFDFFLIFYEGDWALFFSLGCNFVKFQPEKYDFNIFKGFFTAKKSDPNFSDFIEKQIQIARFL